MNRNIILSSLFISMLVFLIAGITYHKYHEKNRIVNISEDKCKPDSSQHNGDDCVSWDNSDSVCKKGKLENGICKQTDTLSLILIILSAILFILFVVFFFIRN